MPYTRHVAGPRHAAILGALICLPALAHGDVPLKLVPHVTYSSKDVVAGSAASHSLGGWEVTAEFDPIRCEVYCVYRQKPGAFGRTPLVTFPAPPITVVEVYTGPASKPSIVVFDPAGLGLPSATGKDLPDEERLYLPGRKVAAAVPTAWPPGRDASHPAPLPLLSTQSDLFVPSLTPLRI